MKKKLLLLFMTILLVGLFSIKTATIFNPKQDINQLTDNQLRQELMDIKGIGEVTAERVVKYRAENKPVSIAELDGVKGIGEKRLSLIKKKFKE